MDPRGEGPDLPVGQNTRVVRVDLIKHLGDVELLLGAHQEVEVRKGKLHVFRVSDAVARRLVEFFGESKRKRKAAAIQLNLYRQEHGCGRFVILTCPAAPA